MGETTGQIEAHIADTRQDLGSNLYELEQRVKSVTDWKQHFRNNPMTREEVVEKARDLMTPVLGAAVCAKLIETVLNLESVKNIRDLRPLLQRQKEA